MRITNETQFRERVKYALDRWIEGYKLLVSPFDVNCEDDDIVEFTEEELDNGEGYILENCLTVFERDKPSLHLSGDNFCLFAKTIGVPVHRYYFRSGVTDCYELVFYYRDAEFYCLMDSIEFSKCTHMVEVIKHESERERVIL